MRRVLSELRESEDVRAVLGDAVRPEPTWYLNGSPWVYGSVCGTQAFAYGAGEGAIITASLILGNFQVKMLQGNIDISFRIKGHKGTR